MSYFQEKIILIVSPENWSHLFVSKHHYAIELSKRNTVYFLNPPSNKIGVTKTSHQNLFVIDYKPFFPGLRFLPMLVQKFVLSSKFKQLESLTGVRFDCIWSFDNSVFFDFSFLLKNTLKISHIVDYSQNFQFAKAAATADICFGVSSNIVDRLSTFNKNSFLIPHGISKDRIVRKDVELPGKNSIKALYAGNLSSIYIDKSLVLSLIESHPEIDFIFLGSGTVHWIKGDNTFFLGKIEHELLLNYLERADVLLLVYDVDKYPDQLTNSHKLMEYLGAGKVIVANKTAEYTDLASDGLIAMTENNSEFLELFDSVILNLNHWNSAAKRERRVQFALENTYDKQIDRIERIIAAL